MAREGDLIFRSRGQTNTVASIEFYPERTIVAAPMLTIRTKPEVILPAYLKWFINLPLTQMALATRAEGTTVQMISKAALEALEIPLPPLARQEKISVLAELADQEEQLSRELSVLRKRQLDSILMDYASS